VVSREWDFGDGASSDEPNPTHGYASGGTYTVVLTVSDDDGAGASVGKEVTVSIPGSNGDPVAGFTSSCTGLACVFTDGSTDADGSVTGWNWSFGDGGTSTARNPSRTYATAGTYTVTLTATDDGGATNQHSAPVTVTAPASAITLTVSGRTDAEKHYIVHAWSGATGTTVDLYRNDKLVKNTPNDGRHTTAHKANGTATYRVKVCQVGTTVCSVERTLTLSN
jgi:PKD repeat protein